MINLKETVNKKGLGIFKVDFFDSGGEPVTPKAASYSVYDVGGNIVNSLDRVEITELAPSVNVMLSGEDLNYPGNKNFLYLTIFYTYDSDAGTDLESNEQAKFFLNDVIGV